MDIDVYAELDEKDIILYKELYLPKSSHKEEIMGLMQLAREEGKREGRREGRFEEAAETLRRLLSLRFKTVPDWAEDLLKNPKKGDLEKWTDRILDAKTVEDVFS